jgi:hypothetical protein
MRDPRGHAIDAVTVSRGLERQIQNSTNAAHFFEIMNDERSLLSGH